MKLLLAFLSAVIYLTSATPALAATSAEIITYTHDTLNIITLISTAAAVFFLIKGGYLYFSSTGKPDALQEAKKTIKNALIGLTIVLASTVIVSVFRNALSPASSPGSASPVNIAPIVSTPPTGGLTQVLIDAVSGFIQNIVESATSPIVNGIVGYLTTTPNLLNNQVVFNFWLVSLGIVDSLFVLVVAVLGLRFMSASTFGFEEVELRQLLPRIGLAFLGANVSLFLCDYVIITCNALVKTILDSTGGLHQAWIVDAINPVTLITGTTPLITIIFLILFLIVSIVLLFMYISRLIVISLGAVLAPFIFLLWTLPKFADFAEISVKSYVVTVFSIFVHVVIIQLASSFLALPAHTNNSLISVAVAVGLFLTLLKTNSIIMQLIFYNSGRGMFKKIGGQIMNIITTDSATRGGVAGAAVKTPRKV